MKFNSLVAALAIVWLFAPSFVGAEEVKGDINEILKTVKCPLSGRSVDPTKTAAYKDSKVYFCCGNCPKGFPAAVKSKPEVAAKANHQLVITKQATQVKCGNNGRGPINKETKTNIAGVQVNTCCKNCLGKLAKMEVPEQIALVFGKNFDNAFVVTAQKKK